MEAYSSSYPASKSQYSVRKSQAKPWKKAAAAPPVPIRVYKVDAMNFRDLVQKLTGAPEFKPELHHHQQLVDTPMLSNRDIAASTYWYQGAQSDEALGMKSQETTSGHGGAKGSLEFNLSSPSSNYNWWSQGAISGAFEPGRVL